MIMIDENELTRLRLLRNEVLEYSDELEKYGIRYNNDILIKISVELQNIVEESDVNPCVAST
jgi:hypothetical protein